MDSIQFSTKSHPRIGLFTDTYRPTVNGISVVVDTLRRTMEAAGWEVFIVCPATRNAKKVLGNDDHIITMPSIKGWPYEEYDVSFFWPPAKRRALAKLDLDAVMFFTPGQIGQLATLLAEKEHIPIFAQHSTDVVEYIRHYSGGITASFIMLLTLPFFLRLRGSDWKKWWAALKPQKSPTKAGQRIIAYGLSIWFMHCDGVVALSRKTARQLQALPDGDELPIATIPVGVDPLPVGAPQAALNFRKQLGISLGDTVLLYAGRISAEKNLDVLIPTLEQVNQTLPRAKLVFVGDFDYRAKLQAKAGQSSAADNIIFTGKLPREELGTVYASADVFMFPSKTDTQGLVLHEAVGAGLPVVMCDPLVTEVVKHDENGYIVPDNPEALAQAVLHIVQDPRRTRQFRLASKQRAARYSEMVQTKKLLDCIEPVIAARR